MQSIAWNLFCEASSCKTNLCNVKFNPINMQKLFLLFTLISFEIVFSQTQVSKIYTNYNTFWQTGVGNVIPDNSHDLLAFTVGGVTYSTGVNDLLLEQRNVVFEDGSYAALPINASQPASSSTYIGVGTNFGGSGNVTPVPVSQPFFQYLGDGTGGRGLDIGTAIFNYPSGSRITFDLTNINPNSIGDGIPDIVITQMGDIGNVTDKFYFLDENNISVAPVYNVSLSGVTSIGRFSWKFYSAINNPPTFATNVASGTREVRLLALDWTDLGLTAANVGQVKKFVQEFSGQSDLSFIAYNRNSVSLTQFIDGYVFKDSNGGTPDGLPFPGLTVSRRNSNGVTVTTTTDAFGYYRFDNIISGTYRIEVTVPTNYTVTGNSSTNPNNSTNNFLNVNVSTLPVQNRNFGLYRSACVKTGATGTATGGSEVGILTKARQSNANWPANVPNGHIVMDSSNKGFVVTHITTTQRNAMTPVDGMVIYNTDLQCIQLYRGATPGTDYRRVGWNCITKTCNEE